MSTRKKRLIFIQAMLLSAAMLLLYIFYYKGNIKDNNIEVVKIEDKKIEKLSESNFFENVEYNGIDSSGNRYLLKSQIAYFDDKKPELVNMEEMEAIFYFKDGTILKVFGKNGIYNNKTNDMKFRDEVKVIQSNNQIYADNLDYFNSEGIINIYGNVFGKSLDGNFNSDILNINIDNQSADFLMNNNDQVKINLKK
tara:strand:+ start:649 stop:1236 length:588 start_codon:yes stop_codon:yes gene_type:complete